MLNTLQKTLVFLSRFIAIDKPFEALTISSAMRGGREVVGISLRRDEVKPAFKQQQQQHSNSSWHPAHQAQQTSLLFHWQAMVAHTAQVV